MTERSGGLNPYIDRDPRPGFVVAMQGEESLKTVDNELQRAIPFVGADRPGEFSQVGVGVILPDSKTGYIWGLVMPHKLIQSWRAMKLLEHVAVIEHGTLSDVWYSADREPHQSNQDRIEDFISKLGEEFRLTRTGILTEVPTVDELESMLSTLRDNKVEVESWELQREVSEGRLAPHPLIDELIRKDEERRLEYQHREEELKQSLAPEQSLAVLFQQLGVDNMIIGGGFGAYGFDWGHTELEALEKSIRKNSYYSQHGEPLQRTTQTPKTWQTDLSPGVTMFQTEVGDIENPSVETEDGTRYTFTEAKFHEGIFIVTTKVEPKEGEPREEVYTIPQLRELLGELLQPRKGELRQGLRRIFKRKHIAQ